MNNYLEKLQNSPHIPLFEELDFGVLIKEFDAENALIYANLDYFIYKALKSNMIDKNNSIIQINFTKLKTEISIKLFKAKESRQIIAVPIERLINQIDKVLGISPERGDSARSI